MKTFIEGDTDPIDYDIKKAATPSATPSTFDATGMTVTMVIKAKDRTTSVDVTGKVSWLDQLNSRVRFARASTDLLKSKSPYFVHWVVTDALGKEASWPEGDGEEWVIEKRGEA
jgi:hypothetical protein